MVAHELDKILVAQRGRIFLHSNENTKVNFRDQYCHLQADWAPLLKLNQNFVGKKNMLHDTTAIAQIFHFHFFRP